MARRRGQRAGTSRTRSRSTSSSAGSAATRSETTPSARAGPSPRPSAGCRPTSATTPRTDGRTDGVLGQIPTFSGEASPENVRFPRLAGETSTLPAPSSGTWTAPSSTPSPTGSSASSRWRSGTAGPGPTSTRLSLVGNDLIDSATLHPRAHGHRPDAERDRRGAPRRRRGDGRAGACRGDRAPSSCSRSCRRRRPVRAGHHVVTSGSWSRCSGALPAGSFESSSCGDEVDHGKPHPEPYLTGSRLLGLAPGETAWRSRTRRPALPRHEAAGCRVLVVPSQVEMPREARWVLRETLVGLAPHDLAALHA